MTPPQYVEVSECRPATGGLFETLQQSVSENPELGFVCAPLLKSEPQRDQILRGAFVAAAARRPEVASRHLAVAIDRPWVTDAGFFPLAALAGSIAEKSPATARTILIKAAERYPGLALREYQTYSGLAFGIDVFQSAALAAPDEAVGLASGNSTTAAGILSALRASKGAEFQVLSSIAADPSLGSASRQRVAVFFRQIASGRWTKARALENATGARFFTAVTSLRIDANASDAAIYDRVLENCAEVLFRMAEDRLSGPSELQQLSARDVYFVLTYGRTEEDDLLFGHVFDRYLLPKLRNTKPSQLVAETRAIHLVRFLSAAAAHHRLEAFLSADGPTSAETDLLGRALEGLGQSDRPLEDTVEAAEIIEVLQDTKRVARLLPIILAGYQRDPKSREFYGLLAATVSRKLGAAQVSDPEAQRIASHYQGYFREPTVLNAESLFNLEGLCIQEQFFYDDEDAAASFESFERIYKKDPAWKWEDRDWYVHVTAGNGNRRIEIYANVPHSIRPDGGEDRRHALAKLLKDRALAPSVLIHRGHTWYVDQSLRYLAPSPRLVYLGSCRGLASASAVITMANQAQMIATRGVGTETINDPLLKAINDELLRGEKSLEWDRFWRAQESRLGAQPDFRDYISPPRNTAAILLRAYYDYLAGGQAP